MPARDQEFWDTAKDWSCRKHLILGYYLKPAIPKLRTQSPDGRVIIVDGFAGQGRYDDGSPGAPMLLGQLADSCRTWKVPADLRILNVEADLPRFELLRECTQKWEERETVRNIHGTFRDQMALIEAEASSRPLIAFLDPFRPSEMAFADFEPLLRRSQATEVLIILHTPAIRRVIATLAPGARARDADRARNRAGLNAVFGGGRWEGLVSGALPTADAIADCFADEVVARANWRQVFACTTGIEARYGTGLKYHVVFATRHPHAVVLMNDAFCQETHAVYRATGVPAQPALELSEAVPPVEMTEPGRIKLLSDSIVEIGRAHPGKRWKRADLIFESITRSFGRFKRSEHRAAIEELLSRDSSPRLLGGQQASTGRWQVNDDTVLWFELDRAR